jgi:hypothetical protein
VHTREGTIGPANLIDRVGASVDVGVPVNRGGRDAEVRRQLIRRGGRGGLLVRGLRLGLEVGQVVPAV